VTKDPAVQAPSESSAVLPDVLTVSEAALLLRIDSRTVIAMIDNGRLAAADISAGGKRRDFRIARTAVEKLLNKKPEA
jgi:excisionase family DNA binding protein